MLSQNSMNELRSAGADKAGAASARAALCVLGPCLQSTIALSPQQDLVLWAKRVVRKVGTLGEHWGSAGQLSPPPSPLPLRRTGPRHRPAQGHPLCSLNPAGASYLPVYSTPFSSLPSILALPFLVRGLFSPLPGALSRRDR